MDEHVQPDLPPTAGDGVSWGPADGSSGPVAEPLAARGSGRPDAATARVVLTVAVIGMALSGLGVLGASRSSLGDGVRVLVLVVVGLSTLSVVAALWAQTMMLTAPLTSPEPVPTKARRQARWLRPAGLAAVATGSLAVAVSIAGLAGVMIVAAPPGKPSIRASSSPTAAILRVPVAGVGANVTVEVTFRGMKPGQPARGSIIDVVAPDPDEDDTGAASGADAQLTQLVVAQSVVLAGPGGVATLSLAAANVTAEDEVKVRASGGDQVCEGSAGVPDKDPVLVCHAA